MYIQVSLTLKQSQRGLVTDSFLPMWLSNQELAFESTLCGGVGYV